MENCMRHHRTAKGTLTHSSSSIPRDNDESKAWEVASYLVGTVDMHPGMDLLDVIPFGGDLKFEETERVQRLARTEWSRKETGIVKDGNLVSPAYKQVDNSAKDVDATGVIKIKVTDTPVGMPLHGSNGMPCDYSGGVRIIRDKIPTGIIQELHEYSDTIPSSKHVFDESKAGVQAAEEILAAHYEKTCSWLSNHTILTKTAASKVGEFLCPPPVFFFEKGDICIDLWWGGLEGHHTVCRALPTYTQLIARRQRVPSISTDAPGPLAARPLTYEEIHRQEMKQFDEEIQTLKMKKQLARFAFYCYQTISRANNDEALELEFKINWWNRDKRCQIVMMGDTVDVEECVRYMDKTFFDEQLARYNLRLESFEFDYLHRFVFARIEN